ncbi:MAG: efflux RND transporter permease subunit [Candidatus Binatia bacterium]|nr:efflux RND transporter permease subunit [Candidatus Binatia bacterium]
MKIIEFCVRYPVTVMVGVLLALIFGWISLVRLPLQMIPTVDRPDITVETDYQGAAPLEVEREITDRLEDKLNAVESLREITSTSIEGKSTVILKFDWGTNKDIARLGVSEKLDLVKDIPPDAEESQIRAVNSDEESPIAWIIVETTRDLNEVWEEVEEVIAPRLERVNGVGAVWRFGGQDREVQVTLDSKAMAARGISVREMRQAILRENRNIKGGDLSEGKRRHVVRTLGQFTAIEQIGDVIVRRDPEGPVYVGDIAKVAFGHEDRDRVVRINGRPAIGMGVLRRSGANTLEVMKGIKAELANLNGKLYKGKGIQLTQVYDETEYITDSLDLVTNNIYYAFTLAVVVLLLFLRSVSSIFVIAVAIPVSVVATFILLSGLGRTLNIITLAGLAFATGMVVDNAVVVLENIYRHREMGKRSFQAALDGAQEVWGAILAATLTTVAVFVPVLYIEQEAGQLFRDIALAISGAVLISLVVALTVIPMLSARIISYDGRVHSRWVRLPCDLLDRFGSAFVGMIVGFLNWLRLSTIRRLCVIVVIVLGSLVVAHEFAPPLDYLPRGNRNLIFTVIRTPPGTSVEQKEETIKVLESRFLSTPDIDRVFAVARVGTPIMGAIVKPQYASLYGMRKVVKDLRRRSRGIAGTERIFITQSSLFRQRGAFFGGSNIDLDIKGNVLETVRRIAAGIEDKIRKLSAVNFVNSSFEWGNPELRVVVDRERVADLGLSVSEVGEVVETIVEGTLAGVYREGGKELDIVLKGPGRGSLRTQDIGRVVLSDRSGRLVQLSDITDIRPGLGPTKVEHVDLDRAIKLTTNIRDEIPLERAVKLVEEAGVARARSSLPLGYSIDVSGQAQNLVEAWNAFKWSFILAVVVIYLLMCSLFESWTSPFIIMFSVPLAATGGILAVSLAHANEPSIKMDTVTMLGFIILAGIVVNNAILIVHQTLNFMREGRAPQEALIESVRSRVRPIFMTSTTTVFAMLPLVLSRGSGSELYRGLGSAVLGGLTLSTLFTLVLIPTLYSLWLDIKAPVVEEVSEVVPMDGSKGVVVPETAGRD